MANSDIWRYNSNGYIREMLHGAMNELVMPETVASQLQGLPHPVNLFNSSGKKIGYFVPIVDPSSCEIVGSEPSANELDTIERSEEWYSTDELHRRLEKLG
jgi:hypothetical protein